MSFLGWMSRLSPPLLVATPKLPDVLPLEPKARDQATTKALSQVFTSLPSFTLFFLSPE